MSSSTDVEPPLTARDPWRASLRASRERRAAALRRRRRRLRSRTGAAVALASLTVLAGGAMAAPAGPAAETAQASLRAGATGSAVVALQEALGIPADGVYGPRTRAAVRRYQRSHGLAADGIAGPATLRALGVTRAAAPAPAPAAKPTAPTGAAAPAPDSAGGSTAAAVEPADADADADAGTDGAGPAPTAHAARLLARIAVCESGGDLSAVSPSGRYRGKYQFSRASWRAVGGRGDPAAASEPEQDRRAHLLLRRQGRSAWPVCAA